MSPWRRGACSTFGHAAGLARTVCCISASWTQRGSAAWASWPGPVACRATMPSVWPPRLSALK
eukprot:15507-Heterocapsa_arctica.AAC.1